MITHPLRTILILFIMNQSMEDPNQFLKILEGFSDSISMFPAVCSPVSHMRRIVEDKVSI